MLYTIQLFAPFVILLAAGISYLAYSLNQKRKYKTYISEKGSMSGKEAAYKMMKHAGYKSSFAVSIPKRTLNPFEGNIYFPDENLFVMTREIMDGKSILAACIGFQLAAYAINYKAGNLNIPNSGYYMGKYGIKYKFEEEKILEMKRWKNEN